MTTWVLLRGLTRECGHWGAFPQLLAERLSPARVVPLDLPGNGALHHQHSPLRVQDMVGPCRAQLHARGIAGPYRLVAMSLGAMVALAWAEAYPGEVSGSVLINTSVRPFSPFYRRLRPSSYLPLLGLLTATDDRACEATILRLTTRVPHPAVVDDWVALRRAHRVSRLNALRQLVAAARFRAPQRPPAVPMLILSGAADTLVDPRCSAALATRWNVPLVRHATGGHDLALDDGPWVASRICDWLSAAQSDRSRRTMVHIPDARGPHAGLACSARRKERMKPRITLITLGVDDLERAVHFYRDGLGLATEGIIGAEFEYGAVAFFELQAGLRLGLWPRISLANDAGVEQQAPSATDFSLAHNVSSRAEVDAVMAQAAAAGATITKPAGDTFWGGYAGYFQDPDRHLWEVAWNPDWAVPD